MKRLKGGGEAADKTVMSPLPAFHAKAKADAEQRVKTLQERLADASAFLDEIDEELDRITDHHKASH